MGLFRKRSAGVRAQAELLGITPTERGARQTGKLDVEQSLRLRVALPDGLQIESEHVCTVPHAKSPIVGDQLPVEVDEESGAVLRINFDEMPDLADRARASAAAAQAGDDAGAAAALGFKLSDPS